MGGLEGALRGYNQPPIVQGSGQTYQRLSCVTPFILWPLTACSCPSAERGLTLLRLRIPSHRFLPYSQASFISCAIPPHPILKIHVYVPVVQRLLDRSEGLHTNYGSKELAESAARGTGSVCKDMPVVNKNNGPAIAVNCQLFARSASSTLARK